MNNDPILDGQWDTGLVQLQSDARSLRPLPVYPNQWATAVVAPEVLLNGREQCAGTLPLCAQVTCSIEEPLMVVVQDGRAVSRQHGTEHRHCHRSGDRPDPKVQASGPAGG